MQKHQNDDGRPKHVRGPSLLEDEKTSSFELATVGIVVDAESQMSQNEVRWHKKADELRQRRFHVHRDGDGHHRPLSRRDDKKDDHHIKGDFVPFGLICFGMALLMVTFLQMKWTPEGFTPVMFTFALFSGLGQIIVGIVELIKGNNFAGSVFGAYGCFWCNFFFFIILEVTGTVPSVNASALKGYTLWLCLWGTLTIGFGIFTLRMNGCMQTLFGTLILTFFTLAGGNYSETCALAAGYIGFICGLTALYDAMAILCLSETGVTLWGMHPRKYIP